MAIGENLGMMLPHRLFSFSQKGCLFLLGSISVGLLAARKLCHLPLPELLRSFESVSVLVIIQEVLNSSHA